MQDYTEQESDTVRQDESPERPQGIYERFNGEKAVEEAEYGELEHEEALNVEVSAGENGLARKRQQIPYIHKFRDQADYVSK